MDRRVAIFRRAKATEDSSQGMRDGPTGKSEDSGVLPHIFPQSLHTFECVTNQGAGILGRGITVFLISFGDAKKIRKELLHSCISCFKCCTCSL